MTNYENINSRYQELMKEHHDQRTKVLQALAIEFGAQTVTNWLIWLSTQVKNNP